MSSSHSSYFQDLIASFSSGVVILNRDFIIYTINQSAADILQKDRSEILSQNYERFFSPLKHFSEFKSIIEEVAIARSVGHLLETTLPQVDEPDRHLSLSVSPLIYYEKLFGIFLEIKDVTHIYLLHAKENRVLEEKRAAEQHRSESLRLFSMAVAHQIRNPITVIGGLCRRLMESDHLHEQDRKYLQTILVSGQRLEHITRAVNDFTSMCSYGLTHATVANLLKSAETSLREEYPELARAVSWSFSGTDKPFICCPHLAGQALCEVLRNALEAMDGGGGQISITCHDEDQNFVVRIEDSGRGINDAIRPHIFDPFFTTHEKRVGMGLCKVEQVMKEHLGSVALEPAASQGTVVSLYFPQTPLDRPMEGNAFLT